MLSVGLAMPATAADSDDGMSEVRLGYEQLGMDAQTTQRLVEVLSSGMPVDSMQDSNEPVRTETYVQVGDAVYANDGDEVTVNWYADGSPSVSAREIPVEQSASSGISPFSIQGCTVKSGSGYSNATGCTISGWWGTVQMGFLANYTLVQGGADRITSTYNGFQRCAFPTTCSRPEQISVKLVEQNGAAWSRWASTVTTPVASWEVWKQLNVGGDRAWDTSS